jgi:hypothetical protein
MADLCIGGVSLENLAGKSLDPGVLSEAVIEGFFLLSLSDCIRIVSAHLLQSRYLFRVTEWFSFGFDTG